MINELKLFKVVILEDGILHKLLKVGTSTKDIENKVHECGLFNNIQKMHIHTIDEVDGFSITIGRHREEMLAPSGLIKSFQNDMDIYNLYHIVRDVYRVHSVYSEKSWVIRHETQDDAIKDTNYKVKNKLF